MWPSMDSKGVTVLPISQHSKNQQNLCRSYILLCTEALNKASSVVVEMKLLARYKLDVIFGYQVCFYLIVRVEILDDYFVL